MPVEQPDSGLVPSKVDARVVPHEIKSGLVVVGSGDFGAGTQSNDGR